MPDRWNHNIHYHGIVLGAVPVRCGDALDIGCGEGMLVRRLAGRADRVTGIDRSPEMIEEARGSSRGVGNATFVEGDFLDHSFPEASFDFISAVAVLHHMDLAAALEKITTLLRPGGVLAVIGLAADDPTVRDRLLAAVALLVSRAHRLRRGWWDPGAPRIDPTMSWDETRATALEVLPGAMFRRLLLWRYALVWRKPTG